MTGCVLGPELVRQYKHRCPFKKNTDAVGRTRGCEGVCHAEIIDDIGMGTRHIFLVDAAFEARGLAEPNSNNSICWCRVTRVFDIPGCFQAPLPA